MPVTKNDLTATDLLVMEALTRSITTPSAVTLAADMWTPEKQEMGADPVGFVVWVLENLAAQGLVTYRLKTIKHSNWSLVEELQGRDPYEQLPFQIRLSREGWVLMGYATFHVQVNSRLSTMQRLDPKGDRTNFRKHDFKAEGGVITTETFAEHRVNFPHHIHPLMYEDDMAQTQRRAYVRITEAIEQSIQKYRDEHPDATAVDISDALQFSERTVRYVLYDLPRIRRNSHEDGNGTSQKERIMLALRTMDYDNITELRKVLGRTDTSHDIVHALHDLHSDGKVDFTEKGDRKEPISIHITNRGRQWIDRQESQPVSQLVEEAFAEPIENSVEQPAYPVLAELQAREELRQQGDTKALRYIEAAELLRDTDPETAKLLDEKAAESDIPYPSPVEAEYLRYAASHDCE